MESYTIGSKTVRFNHDDHDDLHWTTIEGEIELELNTSRFLSMIGLELNNSRDFVHRVHHIGGGLHVSVTYNNGVDVRKWLVSGILLKQSSPVGITFTRKEWLDLMTILESFRKRYHCLQTMKPCFFYHDNQEAYFQCRECCIDCGVEDI